MAILPALLPLISAVGTGVSAAGTVAGAVSADQTRIKNEEFLSAQEKKQATLEQEAKKKSENDALQQGMLVKSRLNRRAQASGSNSFATPLAATAVSNVAPESPSGKTVLGY